MKSVLDKIVSRIQGYGRGSAFSSKDFLNLGTRTSVDNTLVNLAESGKIRRVIRGIYDFPKQSKSLGGQLSPDYSEVAKAIARKRAIRIEPTGAWAANLLGLSTQVPAKIIYLTSGKPSTYTIGKTKIIFKKAAPKELMSKSGIGGLVVRALQYLGKDAVDDKVVKKLRNIISEADKKALLRDARYTTDWVYEVIKQIASEVRDKKNG